MSKIKPPSFIIIPYQLIADRKVKSIERDLYGIIYWLTKLKGERCTAGNETLAELVQTTAGVVRNSLTNLEQRGYIKRTFKDRNKRLRDEILPLIDFNTIVPTAEPVREVVKKEEPIAEPTPENGREVNEVIALFEPMNPSFERLFANTTQRKVIERMIKKHGFDKVRNAAEYAGRVHGSQFAPVITTPLQLEQKLGALSAHFKRERSAGPKMIAI